MVRFLSAVAGLLLLAIGAAQGQPVGYGGSISGSGCPLTGCTYTPTAAVTSATASETTGAAGTIIPIANPSAIVIGQTASGTNIPSSDQVNYVTGGTSVASLSAAIGEPSGGSYIAFTNTTALSPFEAVFDTTTAALAKNTYINAITGNASAGATPSCSGASCSGAAGQAVITVGSGGASCLAGMLMYDTTSAKIPTDSLVLASTATTITISNNIAAGGIGSSDALACYPGILLSTPTTNAVVVADTIPISPAVYLQTATTGSIASGATISFTSNTTTINDSGIVTNGVVGAGPAGFTIDGKTVLYTNPTLNGSLAVGVGAGASLPPGSFFSTFVGTDAGQNFSGFSGEATCVGTVSCQQLTTGDFDTYLGEHAGGFETVGSNNTCVGNDCQRNGTGLNGIAGLGKDVFYAFFGQNSTGVGDAALRGNSSSAAFGGTATNGDTVTLTFTSPVSTTASITTTTSETLAQMAIAMAAAIDANSTLNSYNIAASASATIATNVVSLTYTGNGSSAAPLTFTYTQGGNTETVTIAGGVSSATADMIGIGHLALYCGTCSTATRDIAMGDSTLGAATTAADVVAIGHDDLPVCTTCSQAVVIGSGTATAATTTSGLVAVGFNAASSITTNTGVFVGQYAGANVTGNSDLYIGGGTGRYESSGNNNTVVGNVSLVAGASSPGTGGNNSIFGYQAFNASTQTTVGNIVSMGATNGDACLTCTYDIYLGYAVMSTTATSAANQIVIATGQTNISSTVGNTSNVYYVFGNSTTPVMSMTGTSTPTTATTTIHGSTFVIPDIANATTAQTGTVCWAVGGITYDNTSTCLVSSARFKRDIEPLTNATAELDAMRPVSFLYKGDDTDAVHFGMIAEEVARIDPRLVANDNEGRPLKIKYLDAIALLVKGFQEQQAEIEELRAHPLLRERR
jgi:hypothetical protein